MNQYIEAKQGDFEKAITYFKKDIKSLRTGRANPAMLDGVQVEAYGSKTAINALANINIADAASITITPWDKGVIKDVEKALVTADLGVSIVNEGEKIRITMPALTEENRKELVKKLGAKFEIVRVEFRKIREDIKTHIERALTDKEITEDDKFDFVKELDEYITTRNNEAKVIKDDKEKDIMTI